MVAHDGIGTKLNAEQRCQNPDTVFDPATAVFVAAAVHPVDAAEPGTPHTARGDVVVGCRRRAHQMLARSGHGYDGTAGRSFKRTAFVGTIAGYVPVQLFQFHFGECASYGHVRLSCLATWNAQTEVCTHPDEVENARRIPEMRRF